MAVSISMIPDGNRLGLPVQEEPFDKLCGRAGKMLVDLAFGWIPGMSLAGGLLSSLASADPSFFCGSSGGNISAAQQTQNIQAQCQQAQTAYNQANQNNKGAKPFDMKQCETDAAKKMAQNPASRAPAASRGNGMTSKMIFDGAVNGNDYFQVYGLVMGNSAQIRQNADKAVQMPA